MSGVPKVATYYQKRYREKTTIEARVKTLMKSFEDGSSKFLSEKGFVLYKLKAKA